MTNRIIWGLVAAILTILLIIYGDILYVLVIGLLATFGVLEYAELMKKQSLRPQTGLMLGFTLSLLALLYVGTRLYGIDPKEMPLMCERLFGLVLIVAFGAMLITELMRGTPEQGLINAAANLLGTVYIGFLFAYILLVRFIPNQQDGLIYLVFLLLVTWGNDTFAYFIGVRFGKHKLSPRISPHKSVEGSLGGLVGGVIASLLISYIGHKPALGMVLLGIVVIIAGQCGDLIESIIKRNAGVKDSGTFLPGHGGVLDRLDSLLFAAPVVYYAVIFFFM